MPPPPTSHPNDIATPSNAGSDTSSCPNASPGQTKPPNDVFARPPHSAPPQSTSPRSFAPPPQPRPSPVKLWKYNEGTTTVVNPRGEYIRESLALFAAPSSDPVQPPNSDTTTTGCVPKAHSSMGTLPPWTSLRASPVICPIFMNASSRAGTTNGCLHSRVASFITLSSSARRTRSARSSASETRRVCCSRFSSSRSAVDVDRSSWVAMGATGQMNRYKRQWSWVVHRHGVAVDVPDISSSSVLTRWSDPLDELPLSVGGTG